MVSRWCIDAMNSTTRALGNYVCEMLPFNNNYVNNTKKTIFNSIDKQYNVSRRQTSQAGIGIIRHN